MNVLITITRQVIIPFPHSVVDFFSNKVKLLTLFTDLPCSKYFVAEIGQNTISVEKFNLDFTLNSPKLKSWKLFNTAICLVGRPDRQSMKYLPHNIQRCSANIEFFGEEPNSVIFLGKIHKYVTQTSERSFSFFLRICIEYCHLSSVLHYSWDGHPSGPLLFLSLLFLYPPPNTSFESKQKTKTCDALIRELAVPC